MHGFNFAKYKILYISGNRYDLLPSAIESVLVMPISGKMFDEIEAKVPDTIGIFILIVSTYKLACVIHLKKPIPISDEEYAYLKSIYLSDC